MTEPKTNGNRAGWLNAVADLIMDHRIRPLSSATVMELAARNLTTARNDGHVTAADILGEKSRNDYKAGWRIITEEMIETLRGQGLVDGPNDDLRWVGPLDGEWWIPFGKSTIRVMGQRERRLSSDRHMLGERGEAEGEAGRHIGMVERGSRGLKLEVLSDKRGGKSKIMELEIHPLALLIPPMTEAEREALREDIAKNGVKTPLYVYDDPKDIDTQTKKPKSKILDGRHRGYFAEQLRKPVRIIRFEGSEDDAKTLVASLNLSRRHLTTAQRIAIGLKLFGKQARKEAQQAKLSGTNLPPKTGEGSQDKKSGEWTTRVAEKLGGGKKGDPITRYGVENVAKVYALDAPETQAKVESGKIAKPAKAVHEAQKEDARRRGMPAPAPAVGQHDTSNASNWKLLGEIRSRYYQIMNMGRRQPASPRDDQEFAARFDEIAELHRMAREYILGKSDKLG